MERKVMERRTVLKGGVAAIGMLGGTATAMVTGVEQASADAAQSPIPDQILAAVQRFRETILPISIATLSRKLSFPFS